MRDMQRELCCLYKERFQKKMASLIVDSTPFDDMAESPFVAVPGDSVDAEVIFTDTNDPFFYDWFDRRSTKVPLSEEMLWEQEKAQGLTDLSLEKWFRERHSTPLPDIPLLVGWAQGENLPFR